MKLFVSNFSGPNEQFYVSAVVTFLLMSPWRFSLPSAANQKSVAPSLSKNMHQNSASSLQLSGGGQETDMASALFSADRGDGGGGGVPL